MSELITWVGYCSNLECITEEKTYRSETPEEAIIPLARANDLLPGEKISIGTMVYPRFVIDEDNIAEAITESIAETTEAVCGSVPGENITADHVTDLMNRIASMFREWTRVNDLRADYWICFDAKEYTIPEEGYFEDGENATAPGESE